MDRLEAMSVLITVVREGSLSAGARALRSSLPTISRRIAELERHLGTQLLIRTARRVELTEAGQGYVRACRRIIEQVEEAELAAAGEYLAPRGELTITAPVMFGRLHVLPVAFDFLEAHPEVSLRVCLSDRNVSIAEEHIHLAVRIGELDDQGFIATRVAAVTKTVCASPRYLARRGAPAAPIELSEHDTIAIAGFGDAEAWDFQKGEERLLASLRPLVTVNMPEAALDAVLAGTGIARLLSYQVAAAVESGALVPLLENFAPPPTPVSLVYPAQELLPAKLRAFLNWAAPRLRARLARDQA